MKYYQAINYGKGFITHQDSERCYISGWPADIWVTNTNDQWAQRVNATEKTRAQAQALVDAAIDGQLYPQDHPQAGQQVVITLPETQSC
jgi:hypothetical protein